MKKEAQNITLRLSITTLDAAKKIASARGTSMSGLLVSLIEEAAVQSVAYEQAKHQALALPEKGYDLGTQGRVSSTRDSLHDRR